MEGPRATPCCMPQGRPSLSCFAGSVAWRLATGRLLGEQAGRGFVAPAAAAAAARTPAPAASLATKPLRHPQLSATRVLHGLAASPLFDAPPPCTSKLVSAAAASPTKRSGLMAALAPSGVPMLLGRPASPYLRLTAARPQHASFPGSNGGPSCSPPAAPAALPATGGGTGSPRRHLEAWLEDMRQQGYTVVQDAETGRIEVEGHGGSLCLYARKTPSEWRHAAWTVGVAAAFAVANATFGLLPACAMASPLVFIPAFIIARNSVR